MLELTTLAIENNAKISVVWFGSFISLVWCIHPETVKPVLKGTGCKVLWIKSEGKQCTF